MIFYDLKENTRINDITYISHRIKTKHWISCVIMVYTINNNFVKYYFVGLMQVIAPLIDLCKFRILLFIGDKIRVYYLIYSFHIIHWSIRLLWKT